MATLSKQTYANMSKRTCSNNDITFILTLYKTSESVLTCKSFEPCPDLNMMDIGLQIVRSVCMPVHQCVYWCVCAYSTCMSEYGEMVSIGMCGWQTGTKKPRVTVCTRQTTSRLTQNESIFFTAKHKIQLLSLNFTCLLWWIQEVVCVVRFYLGSQHSLARPCSLSIC